ncbi:hypothetical protein DPMN_085810 [Dreissena polymorpha]|uniref:Uncharacterized protein n=1 Tax=Dreissena polymorpha TaxID=45954 RepID=A0A9D3YGF4_DREPO|nr:hypothetical protein DPMN_085810 [Dreissena polymorpha]
MAQPMDSMTQYQNANREVRKKMNETKESWIEEHCNTIGKEITTGCSKNASSPPQRTVSPRHLL